MSSDEHNNLDAVRRFFQRASENIHTVPKNVDPALSREREFLFGISFESFGIDNIESWLKYESQRSKIWIEHEESRLKYREFKLKKNVQTQEAISKLQDSDNERELRKENAKKAFLFSSTWAIFIGCFVLLHGLKGISIPFLRDKIIIDFKITETEFIFVCGTLTASVLIFYLTVIKNLFPNKPEPKESNSEQQ